MCGGTRIQTVIGCAVGRSVAVCGRSVTHPNPAVDPSAGHPGDARRPLAACFIVRDQWHSALHGADWPHVT